MNEFVMMIPRVVYVYIHTLVQFNGFNAIICSQSWADIRILETQDALTNHKSLNNFLN